MVSHIDGIVQDCSNSVTLAMKLLHPCAKPSVYNAVLFAMITAHTWYHYDRRFVAKAKKKKKMMTFCCVAVNFGNIRTSCLSYCPSYQWCPCVYNVTHLTANTLCLIPLTWYCRSSGNPLNRHPDSCYLWLRTRHMTRYMTFLRLDNFSSFFTAHTTLVQTFLNCIQQWQSAQQSVMSL